LLYGETDRARYVNEGAAGSPYRDEFRRDYARVIHSPSFRRLQGKTQLFPGHESDFFRNRLTHSLEVAQIAESIAYKINHEHDYFKKNPIDTRLCMTAALLHDIGHPPFGHNGEEALDEKMRSCGGFEGNAQTLRIVTQLEKKRYNPSERCLIARRAGLNLTYRTLSSVLKYDSIIPVYRPEDRKVAKGYYAEDAEIVEDIKRNVAPGFVGGVPFKTIECAIMDLADDIAYSTYDLEDSFKVGFLTPTKLLGSDLTLLKRVADRVAEKVEEPSFDEAAVLEVFSSMFAEYVSSDALRGLDVGEATDFQKIVSAMGVVTELENLAEDGHVRTAFTSNLVGSFVEDVFVEFNSEHPQLSSVKASPKTLRAIETLKTYTYEAIIASNKVKLTEYRGKEVVGAIFDALTDKKGYLLLPDDVAKLYDACGPNEQLRKRVVCDFIAGMTDRYAVDFYGRLHSDTPQSMFKAI